MELSGYITLKEYADLHGVSMATMRQRIARGRHSSAMKFGRNWIIRKDEPFVDGRKKS